MSAFQPLPPAPAGDRRPDDVDDDADEVVAQTIPNTNNKGEQQ